MQEQKVIQFIDTVVLPRHNASREAFFDGKIGMWHFVRHRPAERNSRNRSADTMVTTLVNVDGRVCTNYVLNKVVPAIKAKFQSDIKKYKMVSLSVDDVIKATLAAFEMLRFEKLQDVFLSFQAVMPLLLEHNEDNHFCLPHIKMDAMRSAGTLIENVTCPVSRLH
ncbi:hypothetical protein DYB28_000830 [Aphanomyces astaci]|uniref:Uncharacterized protein n=1 Tax=Aphanomyces astaci TaxID=112090 RepID=A0A9X8DYB4_APHAT|nr:hypothetical protein DYB28_000830 [Aphanomyces astaci]